MNPPDSLAAYATRIEVVLDRLLPSSAAAPTRLHEAMRYVVLGGGKRVRAFLVYATGSALGVPLADLDAAAAALEFLHAYSLVHDDLPAMDDDDLRRGQPTCHKAYDEATAILVGDALQALAFESLCPRGASGERAVRQLQMVRVLAEAAGSLGMVGGQAIDLYAVGQHLSLAELEDMHRRKTGALIAAAVQIGALAADAVSAEHLAALKAYALALGLAFQVRDDLLDIEASTEALGKPQGSDERQNKPTYPKLLGQAGARASLQALHVAARKALEPLPLAHDELAQLADYVVMRSH